MESIKKHASSGERRILDAQAMMVLDLFTRHGDFWDAICAVRTRWGISPADALPGPPPHFYLGGRKHPWDAPLYGPTSIPDVLGPSLLPEPDDPSEWFWATPELPEWELLDLFNSLFPDGFADRREGGRAQRALLGLLPENGWSNDKARETEEWQRVQTFRQLWWREMRRLHDQVVPRDCRGHGPDPSVVWDPFLSACATYDPPADCLVLFTKHIPVTVNAPVYGEIEPAMVNAPIVVARDANEAERATRDHYETLFSLLAKELAKQQVDLHRVRQRVEQDHPEVWEQRAERRRLVKTSRFITVDEHTTKDDVRHAFELLKRDLPPAGRPPRNPLEAVQIAIYMDSFDLDVPTIACGLGWPLGKDAYGTERRSDKVGGHAKYGRQLLADRGCSSSGFRRERK